MSLPGSSILTRPAVQEDCHRMMELVHELAVFERAPDAVTVTLEHFIETGFGEHPVWWAYVAEADGLVVGFALYYIRYSTWQGKKMYLEDILVTEEWRGKGIGSLLMDELIKVANEQQFPGITWQVLHWNEPAIKFYEKYQPKFDNEWVNVMLNFNY
jgi:ribosomal protein S18 acetylase RimI-like enzyme